MRLRISNPSHTRREISCKEPTSEILTFSSLVRGQIRIAVPVPAAGADARVTPGGGGADRQCWRETRAASRPADGQRRGGGSKTDREDIQRHAARGLGNVPNVGFVKKRTEKLSKI
jgi:hypothetical protein